MERKKSVLTSALLSKQLDNIAETLAKASQRRDAELQRRRSKLTLTPRNHSDHVPPADAEAVSPGRQSRYDNEQVGRPKKGTYSMYAESLSESVYATSATERE